MTKPSDSAIEAAARELADADARDFDTQSQSFRDGDIQLAKFVLTAAYAIDFTKAADGAMVPKESLQSYEESLGRRSLEPGNAPANDGDFNAGVEAAARFAAMKYLSDPTSDPGTCAASAADIRKLKK